MEIILPPNNLAYSCKFCIHDEMTTFVEKLIKKFDRIDKSLNLKKIKFTVDLVNAGYYFKVDGNYGYHGCISVDRNVIDENNPNNSIEYQNKLHFDSLPNFPKDTETFNITFKVDNDWINKNKHLLENLYVTPGGRSNVKHRVWYQNKIYDSRAITKKYGLYKTKIFDRIYTIMKEVRPDLTEIQLAKYYSNDYDNDFNPDFVLQREYDNESNCLKSWDYTYTECIDVGESNVTLSIITIDIERNTDMLMDIIESLIDCNIR